MAFPEYRLILISYFVGFNGLQMRQVANLWIVYEISGSILNLGMVGIFQFLPLVVFGLLGGSLADTMERRKLLLFSQTGNLLMALVLAFLALTDSLEVWHIFAATLTTATVNVFDTPARMSIIPMVVPRSHLINAITLNSSSRHAAMLLGPAMGGLLIHWQGPGATYLIIAAIIFPATVALLFLRRMPPPAGSNPRRISPKHMFEGLKFVWSTHIVIALIALDSAAMLFTNWRVLMPVFAEDILQVGPRGFGILMSAPAAGFLIGSGALLMAGDIKRKGVLVLATFVGYLLAIAIFAVSRSFLLSILMLVAMGGLDGVGGIVRQTVLQLVVPNELRGRASSVLQMFNRGSPSMGFLVLGSMAAGLGATPALLVGSVIAFSIAAVLTISWREVVTYEDVAPQLEPVVEERE
jgi:MFS family permease